MKSRGIDRKRCSHGEKGSAPDAPRTIGQWCSGAPSPRAHADIRLSDDAPFLPRSDNPLVTAEPTCPMGDEVDPSTTTIEAEIEKRKRAECMAFVQSFTVRLALDLLVREPDLKGFFRGFIKMLIDEGESDACGVFVLDDEAKHCSL